MLAKIVYLFVIAPLFCLENYIFSDIGVYVLLSLTHQYKTEQGVDIPFLSNNKKIIVGELMGYSTLVAKGSFLLRFL